MTPAARIPIPHPDPALPAGAQYAAWLAAVRAVNPAVTEDSPPGERAIPDGPLVLGSPAGAWRPERPGDPRDRAKVIAYHRHHGLPLPEWAQRDLPPADPRDAALAALKQQLAAMQTDLAALEDVVADAITTDPKGAA